MKFDKVELILFEEYLKKTDLSDSTRQRYIRFVQMFFNFPKYSDEEEQFREFIIKHAQKKRGRMAYYAIRKYIQYKYSIIRAEKIIKRLPKIKNKTPRNKTIYLNRKDRENIINCIHDERCKLIARLQERLGARTSDVLRLRTNDFRFIPTLNGVVLEVTLTTKGDKTIIRPIYDTLLVKSMEQWLLNHEPFENYVFIRQRKKKEDNFLFNEYKYYRKILKEAIEDAGFEKNKFSTHDFRRCFVQDIYEQEGKDPYSAQLAAGHSDVSTTMRYLRSKNINANKILENRYLKEGV